MTQSLASLPWHIDAISEAPAATVHSSARKWIPWHRSVTCSMLAHAFLTVQRARHKAIAPELPHDKPAQYHHDSAPPSPSVPPHTTGPMIRLTLAAMAITSLAVRHDPAEVLRRHHWRTEHQTAAVISHYQRRGDPLPTHLCPGEPNRSHQQDLPL